MWSLSSIFKLSTAKMGFFPGNHIILIQKNTGLCKCPEKTYLFIVCFSIVLFGMTFFIFLNEKNKKKYLQFRFLSESLKNLQKENTAHSDDKSTDRQSVFCGEENRNTYIGAIIELIQNRIEEKKN